MNLDSENKRVIVKNLQGYGLFLDNRNLYDKIFIGDSQKNSGLRKTIDSLISLKIISNEDI